jgi:hypothetical protein
LEGTSSIKKLSIQLTILAALSTATALGLLRYALIFVALYSLSAKIVSWMNNFFMDDVPSKLPQLFYFSKPMLWDYAKFDLRSMIGDHVIHVYGLETHELNVGITQL